MNERLEGLKSGLANAGNVIGSNLQVFGGQAKVHGGVAAVKIGEGAAQLKEKVIAAKLGDKIRGMFGKKPAEEEPKPEGL